MLLRPEAALIYPVVLVLYYIRHGARQMLDNKSLILGLLVLLTLGGIYLAWKALHFGHVVPNPFYIKAPASAFFSRMGVMSVFYFIYKNALLIALASASILYCMSGNTDRQQKSKLPIMLSLGFIMIYASFYVRIDTLMDFEGRFMYPLLPILIYLTIPILAIALSALESRMIGRTLYFSGIAVVFVLVFGAQDILQFGGNIKSLTPDNGWETSNSLMQKEFRIAQELSTFPGIESLRIAFGDSGVIPYFTGSIWLDVVGLNDSTIARTRNREQLVNYFFGFQADLVIHPGSKDFTWITYGHGPLGDYASWSEDPRWDDYLYVGTSKTDRSSYDLQYFVRKSSPYFKSLKDFLKTNIVDGWYEPLPYRIGTWISYKKMHPTWIPRAEPGG
jgi:hypothetical protein